MPALIPNTGPIQIFVGKNSLAANGTITMASIALYLGTGERGPEIDMYEHWAPVFTDLGGTEEPSEMLFQGSYAVSRITLTKWDAAVASLITADVSSHASAALGTPFSAVGWTVWFVATGVGQDFSVLRFLNSRMAAPASRSTGSQPNKLTLNWQHRRMWLPAICAWAVWDNTAVPSLRVCA